MLLEICIGDAFGVGFEFKPQDYVQKYNNPAKGYPPQRVGFASNSSYSDDGQMSIALVELILSNQKWTPLNIARKFLECFKRDPRLGYSKRLYQFLTECKTADEFLERIDPISDRSGAAMRSVPLCVFDSEDEVIEKATLQAKVTHNTPAGIDSSIAVALMAYYLRNKLGPKYNLPQYLAQFTNQDWEWDKPWVGSVPNLGIPCAKAALTTLLANNNLLDILKSSINYTGDVDTVAAISLGCACPSKEFTKNLPVTLLDGLEDGKYGKTYLKKLDSLLSKRMVSLFQ